MITRHANKSIPFKGCSLPAYNKGPKHNTQNTIVTTATACLYLV